jgi:glucokinase
VILAGDVGGTKTLLALEDGTPEAPAILREATYPSRGFATLEDVLREFLGRGGRHRLRAACFAVAGPVIGGRSRITNLPWELDEARLTSVLGAPVTLVNDLEGSGHGLLILPGAELEVLQRGIERPGHMALIAAGTGLGEAIVVRAGGHVHVVGSEGGHADFAPRTDLEVALLAYARSRGGPVSYEHVLSGPGLHTIYRFLRDSGVAREPAWLRERLAAGDPSAVISEIALAEGHPLCAQALDLFVSIYGAEAGNLALKALALGGVFVGGGIAPKILPKLRAGSFVRAFTDKGPMADLMRSIPVGVVRDPRLALRGAARVARESAGAAGAADACRRGPRESSLLPGPSDG